jgi:hypothetical protein
LDGVTPNDRLDADTGPNDLQNFPTITSARPVDGGTLVTASLTSAPNTDYAFQFYLNAGCDPSGYGEGQTPAYLGSAWREPDAVKTTDGQGNVTFSMVLPGGSPGQGITATVAEDLFNIITLATSSTSEFSACRTITVPGISVSPTSGLLTTEAGGTAIATVVLDVAPTADVTIPLSSSNIREGTVSPASLTFTPANWSVPQTVTLTGVDDQVSDGNVVYALQLGPASSTDAGYSGLDPIDPTVVSQDNEPDPAVSIADASVAEGNTGSTPLRFTVTLAPASTTEVTVAYATADGTATQSADYTPTAGRLSFAPGETSKTVVVPIVADTVNEADEWFAIALSDVTNASCVE